MVPPVNTSTRPHRPPRRLVQALTHIPATSYFSILAVEQTIEWGVKLARYAEFFICCSISIRYTFVRSCSLIRAFSAVNLAQAKLSFDRVDVGRGFCVLSGIARTSILMRTTPSDQPGAGLKRHLGPKPIKRHDHSIPEAD
jgi:hypothetical protein